DPDSVSCLNREGSPSRVAAARAPPYAQVWRLDPQSQRQTREAAKRASATARGRCQVAASQQRLPVRKIFCKRGLLRICFVTYSRSSHAVLALTTCGSFWQGFAKRLPCRGTRM